MPALHLGASSSTDSFNPNPAACWIAWGSQQRKAQIHGPLCPHGRQGGNSELLASACPSLGHCGYLGSEPEFGRCLCFLWKIKKFFLKKPNKYLGIVNCIWVSGMGCLKKREVRGAISPLIGSGCYLMTPISKFSVAHLNMCSYLHH